MKKKYLLFTILFAIIFPLFGDDGFRIKDYIFEGTLSESNVMSVTETIYVDFFEPRHGIYRTIPEHFRLDRVLNGKTVTMDYYPSVAYFNVKNDIFTAESESNVFSSRIGDAEVTIEGEHVYTLSYEYHIPSDRIKDGDFFYYSVLGAFWEVGIDKFSYKINFEKPLPSDTQFNVFSGDKFSESNDLNVKNNMTTSAIWGTVENIGPEQAVTLFAELPEGFFNVTDTSNNFVSWIFCVLSIMTSLFILFKALTTRQNEPVATVEFYPPEGIAPVDIGYIIDSSADDSDFISMIPYWAQKGYIKIEETEERFKKHKVSLYKLQDLPHGAPEYQKKYFKALFKNGNKLDTDKINEDQIKDFDEAKTALKDAYKDDKALFTGSDKGWLLVLIAAVLAFIGIGTTSSKSLTENMFLDYGVILLWVFGASVNTRQVKKRFTPKTKIIGKIIFGAIAILVSYSNINVLAGDCIVPLYLIGITIGLFALVAIFNGRLVTMTDYGRDVTGKLLGFKEFINSAELPKLKVLMAENPSYYYDILPYASAFGLSQKWTKKFSEFKLDKPNWYISSNPEYIFDPHVMEHTISSSVSQSVSSVRAASSHSSSGGHSGGGGGGGGGGSW